METREIDGIVRDVVTRELGSKAARRARVKRVETAHVVQLWERGGPRRYTVLVDGPEPVAVALSESREAFGAATEGDYRDGKLAHVPGALAARVEKVIAGWGAIAAVDLRHVAEPVAIVRAARREVVVALGARRLFVPGPRSAVASLWWVFVPSALIFLPRVVAQLFPYIARNHEKVGLVLLAASVLVAVGAVVAIIREGFRQRALTHDDRAARRVGGVEQR